MNRYRVEGTQFKRLFTTSLFLCALFCVTFSYALPTLNISQVPLTQAVSDHPQVLIAFANSQSMDGTMSGAIMTGSGSLSSSLDPLKQSSSPVNYTVPEGFVPPLQSADASNQAPYSVQIGTTWYDNGPSRLNVAKAGIKTILENYMATTDFILETYSTSNITLASTWVYYMSTSGGFTFSQNPVPGMTSVVNPCYVTSGNLTTQCNQIATLYGITFPGDYRYINIQASSDDSSINDVLYSTSSLQNIFVTYNGPVPSTPYPPNYTISNYNQGTVLMGYRNTLPSFSNNFLIGPTNAGYVPYSSQVFYSQRGWAFISNHSSTTGNMLVPLTSAGTTPTTSSVAAAIATFTPYLEPETNIATTSEIKASAGQSPMAGMLEHSANYLFSRSQGSGRGCPPKQYVILISDGLPTQDKQGRFWPPLGSASAEGYGVTATFNTDGSLNTTNSQALSDTITAINGLKANGVKTFVIGLGAGVDPTLNPQAAATLRSLAVAGGTVDYYPVSNMTELLIDLNNIMISVQNGDFTTTAAAVSSTRLTSTSRLYQASFTSSDTPYLDWTGDLTARAIDVTTGFPTGPLIWSSQPLVDTLAAGSGWLSNRLIATWDPLANLGSGSGIPFLWDNLNVIQRAQLQPTGSLGSSRLQYLRGNTALEQRNGGSFRNRSHILGDIVFSQPAYVPPPDSLYYSSSYTSFRSTYANRTPMIYVGANDGMLHAMDANTGVEKFAFVPNGIFSKLFNLSSTSYNQSHLFFVNGSPQFGDVQFSDESWHTVLIGGEGGGGKTVYAIDITDPSSITTEAILANKILWEFSEIDMGYSYSEPQIAPINVSSSPYTFAAFFGNGYGSTTNKAVFYAVNPETGALIRKIDLCAAVATACDSRDPQGLSTVAVAYPDGMQGQAVNMVYAGDLQGNLWAIDVSSSSPASWSARVLFRARNSQNKVQPITTAPVVTLHPSYPRLQGNFVMFATGQLLTTSDLSNTDTQTAYGVWDKPVTNTTFTRSNLTSQTISFVSAAVSGLANDILITTNNTVNWGTNVGWYTDFPVTGQRVVTQPQLLNGSFILTLNAPPQVCNAPFSSMLLEINFGTGGSFQYPQLDITADGIINTNDNYNGNYAVGVGLLPGYATTATIIGPNANNNFVKLISQSGGQQSTIINPNNTTRKTGWHQIK